MDPKLFKHLFPSQVALEKGSGNLQSICFSRLCPLSSVCNYFRYCSFLTSLSCFGHVISSQQSLPQTLLSYIYIGKKSNTIITFIKGKRTQVNTIRVIRSVRTLFITSSRLIYKIKQRSTNKSLKCAISQTHFSRAALKQRHAATFTAPSCRSTGCGCISSRDAASTVLAEKQAECS